MLDYKHFKTSTHDHNNEVENLPMDTKRDFCPRGSNLPGFGVKMISSGLLFVIADTGKSSGYLLLLLCLLPMAYGGVHLTAWNFEFPTAIESLLWKISGILIAGIYSAWFIVLVIVPARGWIDRLTHTIDRAIVLVYIVCRLYLVVEAFVSLRAVPIGVYWTPPWIQMIPHV